MNYKNNLELSIYLRSFGIFDTNIISAIEEIPIEFFKTENINKNIPLKQKFKNKFGEIGSCNFDLQIFETVQWYLNSYKFKKN